MVIEHLPAVYSLYYHLSRLNVAARRAGPSRVTALGAVGSTGLATGPHLHWEVRAAGVAVDPDVLVTTPLVDIPDEYGYLMVLDRARRPPDHGCRSGRRIAPIAHVTVGEDELLEKALKRFKRMVEKEGIVREWKRREYFRKALDGAQQEAQGP